MLALLSVGGFEVGVGVTELGVGVAVRVGIWSRRWAQEKKPGPFSVQIDIQGPDKNSEPT
jgi:hypothetical protein